MNCLTQDMFFCINPNNEEHLNKLSIFEKLNNLEKSISFSLKEGYKEQLNSNIIQQEFCYCDNIGNIIDHCSLKYEKDRKVCYLEFSKIKDKYPERKIVSLISHYAKTILKAEEVFSIIDAKDKRLLNHLLSKGYFNLCEEDGFAYLVLEDLKYKE